MFGRVGSSRHSAVLRAQRNGVVVQRGAANTFCSVPVVDFTRAFHGVEISEEFQFHPEQTTSAIVCHHPQAKYFVAG